jgi:hypothetical protein
MTAAVRISPTQGSARTPDAHRGMALRQTRLFRLARRAQLARLARLARGMALIAALALPSLAGCSGAAPTCDPNDGNCVRILFVGNSYTYVNDLPGTFAALARSGGHEVETDALASGGATLADHLADAATVPELDSRKWNFVVLQEQSEIPSVAASRDYTMYPAVRTLVGMIRQRNETPVLFMTWAHRDGWPANGMPDYESMQRSIDSGYISIAAELDTPVGPVGYTWFIVRRQDPDIALWQDDGSHPSTAGTYLAACVFYAVVFRKTPEGLTFNDGLPSDTTSTLQKAAAVNVLADPGQWGLH